MESQKPQVEELQALQESLELQRRQALALILELQGDGASPAETEKARLKLVIINQELAQAATLINEIKRRKYMFESAEKMQAIAQVLQKSVAPMVKEARQTRDEAETKVQILVARAAKFEAQKAEIAGEIGQLKQEISRVLQEGGDPSDVNRQLRAKVQESEDLETWAVQLKNSTISAAEKVLTEAQTELWKALIEAVRGVRPQFDLALSDHLAQASELSESWTAVIRNLFKEYQTGRLAPEAVARLIVDQKRTTFLGFSVG